MSQFTLQVQIITAHTVRFRGRPRKGFQEHERLVARLEARDVKGAQALMEQHHPERARGPAAATARHEPPRACRALAEAQGMGRHVVVAALFMLSLITYVDRAAISSAKGAIASEPALSDREMGAVFSAFALLGYALAQIPAGWFADKVGPRLALATIVTLWSLFTAMTGAVDRFLDLAHGPAPVRRCGGRGLPRLGSGVLQLAAAGGARPRQRCPLLGGLSGVVRWPSPSSPGSLKPTGGGEPSTPFPVPGLVWAILWFLSFRDHPPSPLPEEPAAATPAPLGLLLRSKGMPLVMFRVFRGQLHVLHLHLLDVSVPRGSLRTFGPPRRHATPWFPCSAERRPTG